jgi:hypothetical protein
MAADSPAAQAALVELRRICADLPEITERPSHHTPTFFVRDKKVLCHLWDDHHGDGVLGIWSPAPVGVQADLVEREPERFYVPPYVGHRGWIGVRLDVDVDWDEIAGILEEAYRLVAPKTLVRQLDAG